MQRMPDLHEGNMTEAQAAVYRAIIEGPRKKVEGPFWVWMVNPELANHAQALGAFCRFGTSLPPRVSELAILIMGAFWRAGYEWAAHAPIALKAGVPASVVEAVQRGEEPVFEDETDRAVHRFCREMLVDRRVSDEAFGAIRARFGEQGPVDLVGILGYYTLISMTIVAFDVPLPEGVADPFA